MLTSVSGMLFSIGLGVIGAIIVLAITATIVFLYTLIGKAVNWIVGRFKKRNRQP